MNFITFYIDFNFLLVFASMPNIFYRQLEIGMSLSEKWPGPQQYRQLCLLLWRKWFAFFWCHLFNHCYDCGKI